MLDGCISYIRKKVETDWDETKRLANLSKHGLDFVDVPSLEWAGALVEADTRFDYGEVRLVALTRFHREPGRLFSVVFVIKHRSLRVISFRRASNREIMRYEQARQNQIEHR